MDYEKVKYKEEWDNGMFVAFDPKDASVVATAKSMGDTNKDGILKEGVITQAEKSGKYYIVHKFPKKIKEEE